MRLGGDDVPSLGRENSCNSHRCLPENFPDCLLADIPQMTGEWTVAYARFGLLENDELSVIKPTQDQAAVAVPRSAAGCQRINVVRWRPRPSGMRHSARG